MELRLRRQAFATMRNRTVLDDHKPSPRLERIAEALQHRRRLSEFVVRIGNEDGLECRCGKLGVVIAAEDNLHVGDVPRVRLVFYFLGNGLLHVDANDLPARRNLFRHPQRMIDREASPNIGDGHARMESKDIVHLPIELIKLGRCDLLGVRETASVGAARSRCILAMIVDQDDLRPPSSHQLLFPSAPFQVGRPIRFARHLRLKLTGHDTFLQFVHESKPRPGAAACEIKTALVGVGVLKL